MSGTFAAIVDDGTATHTPIKTLATQIDDIFCHYRKL